MLHDYPMYLYKSENLRYYDDKYTFIIQSTSIKLPWKSSATTIRGIDFLTGRKGRGPISPKPMTMRKHPIVVTPLGNFLSQIMPQMGAELPVNLQSKD